jgi:hypothetical protein
MSSLLEWAGYVESRYARFRNFVEIELQKAYYKLSGKAVILCVEAAHP